jgi:hypothetical protein
MYAMHSAENLSFDGPALYRIRVQGRIAPSWSDRLAGMTISLDTPNEGPPTTTLVGELRDQASLAGVLNALYELHRALLQVECLSPGNNETEKTEP